MGKRLYKKKGNDVNTASSMGETVHFTETAKLGKHKLEGETAKFMGGGSDQL